ncbi:hypothetical protein HGG72_25020 [Ochrobactrum pecoris]|uniref:Uncharacterized protein n=1 Tax=Brucella pecoris TaxID=867683 RepID=A0A5C5CBX9_9HYPH|nr:MULTISPECIES: hypothetical protein [Brucella]MBB4096254.1 hypothetical protein [Brucella pecoris]NKW82757.1 hypothetical protein [Brucella pecoris]TNV08721.1 hypothetical protein FIB18_23770 [Brucella pecoris]
MSAAGILDEMARRDNIVDIFGRVLARHGIVLAINRMDFHLCKAVIIELTSQPARLSATVLDFMFPHEPTPSTVYHYTGFSGFQGIVSSGELRLYPVRNRLGQGGELAAFAKSHALDGYLDKSQGEEFYRTLSDDLFYASLTRVPPKDPLLMWGAFGGGTGVRLELKVTPKPAAALRPIYYETSGSMTLLQEINDALRAAGEPPFNPWTISRAGAFYLDWTVALEDEVRLLVKRHPDGIDLARNDGASDYWPIPIDQPNGFCDLQLTGVHVAPGGNRDATVAALKGTRFAAVSVTGP